MLLSEDYTPRKIDPDKIKRGTTGVPLLLGLGLGEPRSPISHFYACACDGALN